MFSGELPFTRSRIQFTAAKVDQAEIEPRGEESRVSGKYSFELRARGFQITHLQQCLREFVADVVKARSHGQRSAVLLGRLRGCTCFEV